MDGQDAYNILLERFEDIVKANTRFEQQMIDVDRRLAEALRDNKMFKEENTVLARLERFIDQPEINKLYKAFMNPPKTDVDDPDF